MLISLVAQENAALKLSKEQLSELDARLAAPPNHASDAEVDAFFKRLAG